MLIHTWVLQKKTLNKSLSTNDGVDLSSIFSDFWVDVMQSWQFSNEISNFIGIQIQIFSFNICLQNGVFAISKFTISSLLCTYFFYMYYFYMKGS